MHKHNVHIVSPVLPGRQHRRCGLTIKTGRIREFTHTLTHTITQACWHGHKGRMSVSLCPNECGPALGGFLLILAPAQQDGEQAATGPTAHRPPNSLPMLALTHPDIDHDPHLALMTRARQIPQRSSRSVALHVLQDKKKTKKHKSWSSWRRGV